MLRAVSRLSDAAAISCGHENQVANTVNYLRDYGISCRKALDRSAYRERLAVLLCGPYSSESQSSV